MGAGSCPNEGGVAPLGGGALALGSKNRGTADESVVCDVG